VLCVIPGWLCRRADIYRQKASECDRAADRVADPQIQASYRQMSCKWRDMAEKVLDEALNQARSVIQHDRRLKPAASLSR
jgi:1,2-phenylacetyl-CoA epoxidase PaaB subunit